MDQDADLMRINGELAAARDHNERLITTLRDAREQIVSLKTEVDRLAQPPSGFATILVAYEDATADIMASGKKMRVGVSPTIEIKDLVLGREVLLNESMNIVSIREYDETGEIVVLKERINNDRALVVAHSDEERVIKLGEPLIHEKLRGVAKLSSPRQLLTHWPKKLPRRPGLTREDHFF